MKRQIKRLSPHQNGKVFATLWAVISATFVMPFLLIASLAGPEGKTPPLFLFIVFPIMYFVLGYIMTAIGCAAYNFMFKYVGGIEFETEGRAD